MKYCCLIYFPFLWINLVHCKDEKNNCTAQMFSNNSLAVMACNVQHALQQNWFPDPIQGLFSYQTWNGMDGFWQNGVAIEAMNNANVYLNNSRYKSAVINSYRELYDLLLAYGPQPSFDDMAWYGLAYSKIYESTKIARFLSISEQIMDWIWENGWDETVCNGGVWFDQNLNGKQTIENVQVVQLAGRLARLSKNGTKYKHQAYLVWKWILKSELIDSKTFQVFDGISMESCRASGDTTYTYTAGTAIGALTELYKLSRNNSFLSLAHNLTYSVTRLMTKNGTLVEKCDLDQTCNLDAQIFKGIFMRNLFYLMTADPKSKYNKDHKTFIKNNINAIMENAMCSPDIKDGEALNKSSCHLVYLDGPPSYPPAGPVFDASWIGPFRQSRPIQQVSALDLFLSSLEPGIRCSGHGCDYDPVAPPPRPLSCKDDPCPLEQDCCEYEQHYTCCDKSQKCDNGYCM